MDTKNYTPGPWKVTVKKQGITRFYSIVATSLKVVAYIPEIKTDEPNADLIAAAPELYEALQVAEDFMAGFEDDENQDGINEMLKQIRAAISKATTGVDPQQFKPRYKDGDEEKEVRDDLRDMGAY